ncbi:putative proteophosphoglycan protein ppg4, partial [Toxoplasma gondii RUB]
VEDLSKEIRMLEEKEKSLMAQLWHARQSSDLAAETQTQASGVSSSTEPAEASDMAGQSSPRGTIQVPRDLVERQSEPAFEKPLDEAVASPFVAQTPFRSPTPVTNTKGASRESAAVASTTHSMARGDLTTSSDWLTHAERTSESASSLIWHYQTAPLFAPGAPQAVVCGGPCTSGDSGGPPYSLSPTVEHAGAAHTTGDPRTESDIPEDVVEFVLSYSSPAVMASGDGAALFAESAPSFIQPWSSEYPPPPVVSPSEQAATSASLVQPTTSASDEGATLFAIPASSSAFSRPGWSSPQLQPSW